MNTAMMKVKLQQHAPEIMLWGGAGMVVAGVVTTVFVTLRQRKLYLKHKETLKELDERLVKTDKQLKTAKKIYNNQKELGSKPTVDLEEIKEENTNIQYNIVTLARRETLGYICRTALNIAIPAGLVEAGLFCMIKGHYILKGRLAITAAALATTKAAFETYRQRVVKDAGKEKDEEYFYGTKKTKIEIENPETGKKEKVEADIISENDLSEWGDIYCHGTTTEWDPHIDYNLAWIENIERMLNDKFQKQGILFLNDAREALGMKPIYPDGQFICWHKDKNDSVNIFKKIAWNVNENGEKEQVILVDFDCYGDIRSLM